MRTFPFPLPPTPLQQRLDTLIDRLRELRPTIICCAPDINDDSASDLRWLKLLALDLADAMDPVFTQIASDAGLCSRQGAVGYSDTVSRAIGDELGAELEVKRRQREQWERSRPEFSRASHGTLSKREQGI